MNQLPSSDNFSENPVPNENNILSEHQTMAGKEGREAPNISNQSDQLVNAEKAKKIDGAGDKVNQSIESAKNAYSEHKGAVINPRDISHSNEGKEMASAQFEDANQKTSQFVNRIIDFLKKMDELRMQVVGNMKSGGGKRILQSALLIAGLAAAILVLSSGLRIPEHNLPDSSTAGNNPLELVLITPPTAKPVENQSENNPLELVLITPGSGESNPLELVLITPSTFNCSIHFTSPAGIAKLPNFGPILFEWTDVPSANSYILKVAPPAEASLPWGYAVQEHSKKIYMENFPMGGEFSISIHALSSSEKILCAATIRYNKQEYIEKSSGGQNNGGQNDIEPASTPCVSTGIGYFCP